MLFMLLVATDPDAEPYDPAGDTIAEWSAELNARGAARHGDRLRPAEEATLVRRRDGELVVTQETFQGPATDDRPWLAGYDVIDCADLDEAIELAGMHPMARFGRIEVRPLWPLGLD